MFPVTAAMADAQASFDAGTRRAVSTLEEYGGTADDAWARGSHENYDKDGEDVPLSPPGSPYSFISFLRRSLMI